MRVSPHPCSHPGCPKPRKHRATGLCRGHEDRRRSGIPLDAPFRNPGGRFELHFDKKYRATQAHRYSYEHFIGPIPEGLQLDHLCRNTLCVNPEHLEPVTPKVNMSRSQAPTAIVARTNVCQRGHHLTAENTYLRPTDGHRECKPCRRFRYRRMRARRAGLQDWGSVA